VSNVFASQILPSPISLILSFFIFLVSLFFIRIIASGPRFVGLFLVSPDFNVSVMLTSGWPTAKFNLKRAYVAKFQGKRTFCSSRAQFGQHNLILQAKGLDAAPPGWNIEIYNFIHFYISFRFLVSLGSGNFPYSTRRTAASFGLFF